MTASRTFGSLIAITSGKGGVGKSTLAVNLAIALQQTGATVGLMDADITGPNLPLMMGIRERPLFAGEKLQPVEVYGLKMMSMGFLIDPDQPVIWRGPMIHGAIGQFFSDVDWGPLDYMVVDLPPGTGDAQLTLAQTVPITGVIIITQPQAVALGDALRGLMMFERVNVPIIGVIENMSGGLFGEGGGEKLAQSKNVPFLGKIPLDDKVPASSDSGEPILITHPESPAATALSEIAQEVIARVSALAKAQKDEDSISFRTIE